MEHTPIGLKKIGFVKEGFPYRIDSQTGKSIVHESINEDAMLFLRIEEKQIVVYEILKK